MIVPPSYDLIQDRLPSRTGIIREHRAFESKILGNKRNLIVYLPPDYEKEPKRRYPVFYMHDGQNLMDGATSFIAGKEWRVDETAEALVRAKIIEPLIIVGIDNAGIARADEFLPTRSTFNGQAMGGKADAYGRMIRTEIMPLINQTYRTKTGPQNTWVGGASLGGIVSLYLGFTHPNVFGRIAAVSPSVWWDDREIVRRVNNLPKKLPIQIWLDMGTAESASGVADCGLLRGALTSKGWVLGRDLTYFVDQGAQHNEEAWAKRFGMLLIWISTRS